MKHAKPVAALALCGLVLGAGAVVGQARQLFGQAHNKQLPPISGICGIALCGFRPLDEYKKHEPWPTSFGVRVYRGDTIDEANFVDTPKLEPTGYFRLNLPPGKYELVPSSNWRAEPAPPYAAPQTVVVEEDKFTVATFNFGARNAE